MKELYELQDKACESLGMMLKKGNLNPNDWQVADHITATMKNIEKIMSSKQGGGQSHRGYAHDGGSQAGRWHAEGEYGSGRSHNGGSYNGQGGSYGYNGQSMNGYSNRNYSHHGNQMLEQLKEMKRNANEQEKAMLDRWISEASSF